MTIFIENGTLQKFKVENNWVENDVPWCREDTARDGGKAKSRSVRKWVARISRDPAAIDGIHREFLQKSGDEDYLFSVASLSVGDVIEIGENVPESWKYSSKYRTFAVVKTISADEIELELHDTAVRACRAAGQKVKKAG